MVFRKVINDEDFPTGIVCFIIMSSTPARETNFKTISQYSLLKKDERQTKNKQT